MPFFMIMAREDKKRAFLEKQLEKIVIETVRGYATGNGPELSYMPGVAIIKPSRVLPFGGNVPYFLREMIGDDSLWRDQVVVRPEVSAHVQLFARYKLSLSEQAQRSLSELFGRDALLNAQEAAAYLESQGGANAHIYVVTSGKMLPDYSEESIARLVWQLVEKERRVFDPTSPLVLVTPVLAQYTLTQTMPERDSPGHWDVNDILHVFGKVPKNFIYNLLLDPDKRNELAIQLNTKSEIVGGFKALQDLMTPQPYPAGLVQCAEFHQFRENPTEQTFFVSLQEYAGADVAREIQRQHYRALYQAFQTALMESRVFN